MTTLSDTAFRFLCFAIALAALGAAGCNRTEAHFKLNGVYLLKAFPPPAEPERPERPASDDEQEKKQYEQALERYEIEVEEFENAVAAYPKKKQNLANVLVALFGTPDDPEAPSLADVDSRDVLDASLLKMSAGPVAMDRLAEARGLYREHCAHCHGISGDGMGPTAPFLNPYPRDYRLGKFKFKSTPIGVKPTHDDLTRILNDGIPGTAMPSFKLLAEDQVESLVQYVKYLNIRGEVERRLIDDYANALGADEKLLDPDADREIIQDRLDALNNHVAAVIRSWEQAEDRAVAVPERPWDESDPEKLAESVEKGRELFFGKGACVKCHGPAGLGDGTLDQYDDWTKDWAGANPDQLPPDSLARYMAEGALEPRNIRPRNLRQDVYRGGRRPIDLFWRIHNGIDGTPMPAAPMQVAGQPDNPKSLTTDDVWHLVDYVRSLPYAPMTKMAPPKATLEKEVR